MSRRTLRLSALLLLLALLVVGVSACGSSSSSGSGDDPSALLRDTFGADHPIHSGRVDATLDVDLRGLAQLQQPINLHLSGPFQSNGGNKLPDFALDVDFQGAQQPVTMGAVFAQGGGFLTIEGQAFDLGAQMYKSFKQGYEKAKADAAKKSDNKSQATLSALGISPLRWLKDPKNEGTEDIAGTKTVHIASGVDVGKLLQDVSTLLGKAKNVTGSAGASVPSSLSPQQREAITRSIKSAKVDVWTGAGDHTLRKVAVDVQVDVPKDLQAQAGNLRTGHLDLQVTLAQLNQHQTIRKPGGARPLSDLRSALQQLGLVGSSSSSSTGSGASSAAPSANAGAGAPADYTKCLASAGEDLAKVQACAKYLNK